MAPMKMQPAETDAEGDRLIDYQVVPQQQDSDIEMQTFKDAKDKTMPTTAPDTATTTSTSTTPATKPLEQYKKRLNAEFFRATCSCMWIGVVVGLVVGLIVLMAVHGASAVEGVMFAVLVVIAIIGVVFMSSIMCAAEDETAKILLDAAADRV